MTKQRSVGDKAAFFLVLFGLAGFDRATDRQTDRQIRRWKIFSLLGAFFHSSVPSFIGKLIDSFTQSVSRPWLLPVRLTT
mmetsp:Transcript_5043/g.10083  ORF Transcript_5043/g.10083 Transcript_5043/m.10083 type:complete len:80 (+) Transcript_5043:33-272(+)